MGIRSHDTPSAFLLPAAQQSISTPTLFRILIFGSRSHLHYLGVIPLYRECKDIRHIAFDPRTTRFLICQSTRSSPLISNLSNNAFAMTEISTDELDDKKDTLTNVIEAGSPDVLDSSNESLQARILGSANHRRLNARQIQLTSIAGSIGAALFVAIGNGVLSGPLCLLLGK